MFYFLVFTLYPIWILFQQKNAVFHNSHLKSVITSTDLEQSISNNNTNDNDNNRDDKLVFIKKKQYLYEGFDLINNISSINDSFSSTTDELRKIANYFRKLKQLQLLNSPFVSEIYKLKCAQEVLEEAREDKIEKNNFWETYDDIFF